LNAGLATYAPPPTRELLMPTPRQNSSIPGMGRRLRALRLRHKMTQEDVAERIKMSVDGYRHWEHGRSDGLLRKLQETADAFYMSVPDLLVELGFVETPLPEQVTSSNLSSITPSLMRRWLSDEYGPDVAMAVARVLEGATHSTPDDVRWLADEINLALDRMRRPPPSARRLPDDSTEL
jgi:transcriptional regulator with XRE-family HTH domain